MKKHILGEHPTAWHKWKSVSVAFDLKEPHLNVQKDIYHWLWSHHISFWEW
jgi:hypothetical protein